MNADHVHSIQREATPTDESEQQLCMMTELGEEEDVNVLHRNFISKLFDQAMSAYTGAPKHMLFSDFCIMTGGEEEVVVEKSIPASASRDMLRLIIEERNVTSVSYQFQTYELQDGGMLIYIEAK